MTLQKENNPFSRFRIGFFNGVVDPGANELSDTEGTPNILVDTEVTPNELTDTQV